jgi:hypothetical protein
MATTLSAFMEYLGTAYVEQPAKLATVTNAKIDFINALGFLLIGLSVPPPNEFLGGLASRQLRQRSGKL